MNSWIADFVESARYQRQVRIYPSRKGMRASIGRRQAGWWERGTIRKYRGQPVNTARECARRRRQIEKGMLRIQSERGGLTKP